MRWLLAVTALWTLLGLLPLALLTSSSISLSEQAVRGEVSDRVKTTASVSRVVVEQQMDSLKQLVDEFAQFARMPAPKAVPTDLNAVLTETTALYAGLSNRVAVTVAVAESETSKPFAPASVTAQSVAINSALS